MFERFKSFLKTDTVEFLCDEKDFGVIPEPYPSRKFMPEWYKALPPKVNSENKLINSTIKRCAPFLDSMTVGWIIPLAADVEVVTNADASGIDYKWSFYKTMIENHSMAQISTDKVPHPQAPKPPLKWMNYWLIKVPPGYSVLFTPPFNRPDTRFTCFTGLVDCDNYFEIVNFPFQFHSPNFTGIIKQGTPLVQVLPIKRETLITESTAAVFSNEDIKQRELTQRQRSAHESLYRDSKWVRK